MTVNEIVTAVNIALGQLPLSACPAADVNGDGVVTINEIVAAVDAALGGVSNALGDSDHHTDADADPHTQPDAVG